MSTWTLDDLARLIDHTNLHADATEADMARLCDEAKRYHFKMVAINQVQSRFCSEQLAGTDIDTGAAIAFPLGQTSIAAKVFETRDALANGANEIDYVVNVTEVKQGNWDYVADEMRQIVAVCNEAGVPSKVIFENCYLTRRREDPPLRDCPRGAPHLCQDLDRLWHGRGDGGGRGPHARARGRRGAGQGRRRYPQRRQLP